MSDNNRTVTVGWPIIVLIIVVLYQGCVISSANDLKRCEKEVELYKTIKGIKDVQQ
jgi:hypothetical protein